MTEYRALSSPIAKQTFGACAAMLLASAASAERFECVMEDGNTVRFEIDPNQFVDAVNAGEPIRRKITQVEMGTTRFPAEPFIIGDTKGFSAESLGGGTIMFVINKAGLATQSNRQSGYRTTGICEVLQ